MTSQRSGDFSARFDITSDEVLLGRLKSDELDPDVVTLSFAYRLARGNRPDNPTQTMDPRQFGIEF